jgi:hypothetical protein
VTSALTEHHDWPAGDLATSLLACPVLESFKLEFPYGSNVRYDPADQNVSVVLISTILAVHPRGALTKSPVRQAVISALASFVNIYNVTLPIEFTQSADVLPRGFTRAERIELLQSRTLGVGGEQVVPLDSRRAWDVVKMFAGDYTRVRGLRHSHAILNALDPACTHPSSGHHLLDRHSVRGSTDVCLLCCLLQNVQRYLKALVLCVGPRTSFQFNSIVFAGVLGPVRDTMRELSLTLPVGTEEVRQWAFQKRKVSLLYESDEGPGVRRTQEARAMGEIVGRLYRLRYLSISIGNQGSLYQSFWYVSSCLQSPGSH